MMIKTLELIEENHTSQIQNWLDDHASTGGILRTSGNVLIESLNFPSPIQGIIWKHSGAIRHSSTITIPDHVEIIGELGRSKYNQFSKGLQAEMIPLGDFPAVRFTGDKQKALRNISLHLIQGDGIHVKSAAHVLLENVSVFTTKSTPLTIDGSIWVDVKRCAFLRATSEDSTDIYERPYAVKIQRTEGNLTHKINFDDITLSGRGIYIGSQIQAPMVAMSFRDIVYENGRGAFVNFDSRIAPIAGIRFQDMMIADPKNVPSYIFNRGLQTKNITWDSNFGGRKLVTGDPLQTSIVRSGENAYPQEWDMGVQMEANIQRPAYTKRIESEYRIPQEWILDVERNPAKWHALPPGADVELMRDPIGNMDAGILTSRSPGGVKVFSSWIDCKIGDWFIVGGWIKGKDKVRNSLFGSQSPGFLLDATDSLMRPFETDSVRQITDAWIPVVRSYKATHVPTDGRVGLQYLLSARPNQPTAYAYPFIVHITTGEVPDAEAYRIAKTIKPESVI